MVSVQAMVFKGSLVLFLFLLLSAGGFALSSDAPQVGTAAGGAIEGNIDDIAKTIQTYFPKVDGKIISVEDQSIVVDLGRGNGVSEGVLLTVYREKEPFYHPVTGVALGMFEDEIGTVEVTQSDDHQLKANRVRSAKPIEVGDLIRIPGTRIPLAVSLSSEESQHFLMNELVSALSDTGRFRVDVLSPKSTLQDASQRNNRYLIQLATSQADETFLVSLNLKNTETGRSLSDMKVKINQSQESDLILEHLQYQLFEQRRKQKEEIK